MHNELIKTCIMTSQEAWAALSAASRATPKEVSDAHTLKTAVDRVTSLELAIAAARTDVEASHADTRAAKAAAEAAEAGAASAAAASAVLVDAVDAIAARQAKLIRNNRRDRME